MKNEDGLAYVVPDYGPEHEHLLGHKLTENLVQHLLQQDAEAGLIVGAMRAVVIVAKFVNLEKRQLTTILDKLWEQTEVATVSEGGTP